MAVREIEEGRPAKTRSHTVMIENRERITVTGVEDMDSFNEMEVILLTEAGFVTIIGSDLHINRLNLDDGQLVVEGLIQGLDYNDHEELRQKGGNGIFSRMFR